MVFAKNVSKIQVVLRQENLDQCFACHPLGIHWMQAKHFCRVDGLVFPNILQYNLHHQIAGKRKTHSIMLQLYLHAFKTKTAPCKVITEQLEKSK
jgi:hypothetical protein